MNLKQLREYTISLSKNYPTYKDDFEDLYYLAESEIEEGGSEQHECDLAYNDMLSIVDSVDDPRFDLRKEEEYNWTQEQIQKEIETRNNEKI